MRMSKLMLKLTPTWIQMWLRESDPMPGNWESPALTLDDSHVDKYRRCPFWSKGSTECRHRTLSCSRDMHRRPASFCLSRHWASHEWPCAFAKHRCGRMSDHRPGMQRKAGSVKPGVVVGALSSGSSCRNGSCAVCLPSCFLFLRTVGKSHRQAFRSLEDVYISGTTTAVP